MPAYAVAFVIVAPFICAGAGAWVTFLWARRWADQALPAEWNKGAAAGYQLAQREMAEAPPAVPTALLRPGEVVCRAGHTDYCPSCHADAALLRIRSEFGAARSGLGLLPDLWPGFDEPQAASPLALPGPVAVVP